MARDAVVVRGGLSPVDKLAEAARDHEAHPDNPAGEYAISLLVVEDDGASAEQIVEQNVRVRHGKFRHTTVGDLEDAGYTVVRDKPDHALAILPGPPDDHWAMLEALDMLLGEPVDNPFAADRKKGHQ